MHFCLFYMYFILNGLLTINLGLANHSIWNSGVCKSGNCNLLKVVVLKKNITYEFIPGQALSYERREKVW